MKFIKNKKNILIIFILIILLINNISGVFSNYTPQKNIINKQILYKINQNFYYNHKYSKNKIIILNSLRYNLKGGVKKCFLLGKYFFPNKKHLYKYCIYQIKDYLQIINHPLSKKFPYSIVAENNFFINYGKHIIDNKYLQYININDKKTIFPFVNIPLTKLKNIYVNNNMVKDFNILNKDYKKIFGVELQLNSGYRSIYTQKQIYNMYIKKYGIKQQRATIPGYSEHHTGDAIDIKRHYIKDKKGNIVKDNYQWLKKNIWKYGFIQSYNNNCLQLGIQNENWHYRWVGITLSIKWKDWELYNKSKCNIFFLKELHIK